MADTNPRRRFRWSYSLRALLVFITLFMLWGGYHTNRSWEQRAKEAILLRGSASLEYEVESQSFFVTRCYQMLVRTLWGERHISRVTIHADMTEQEIDAIVSLESLEFLGLKPQLVDRDEMHSAKSPFRRSDLPPGAISKILANHQLSGLDVSYCQLTHDDFVAIGNHKSLKSVSLNSSNISDRELALVLTLPQLREVRFSDTRVTGRELERQSGSGSIEEIRCMRTPVGAALAAFVRKSPRISELDVLHSTIDDAFVRELEGHPALEALTLGPEVTDGVVDSLLTMPSLKLVGERGSLSQDARSRLLRARPTLRLN